MATKRRRKSSGSVSSVFRAIEKEALAQAHYDLPGESHFHGVLRAVFIKSFEFARYSNRLKSQKADEGAFFIASALRGITEDLITVKFLMGLSQKHRDEVVLIEMMKGLRKTAAEQAKFFATIRPFQPVLKIRDNNEEIDSEKQRLTEIGRESGLWKVKGKLPPIEQMADKVGFRVVYDYFYRVTSDIVHFNPRIAFRMGWGEDPERGIFTTKNFCRYYLDFSQVYSAFLFCRFCETFQSDLGFSPLFMKSIKKIEERLNDITRWPEAVTYEEMNQRGPGPLERIILRVAHENPALAAQLEQRLAPSSS